MRYVVDDRFIDQVEKLVKQVKDLKSASMSPWDRLRWERAMTTARAVLLNIEDGFDEEGEGGESNEKTD